MRRQRHIVRTEKRCRCSATNAHLSLDLANMLYQKTRRDLRSVADFTNSPVNSCAGSSLYQGNAAVHMENLPSSWCAMIDKIPFY